MTQTAKRRMAVALGVVALLAVGVAVACLQPLGSPASQALPPDCIQAPVAHMGVVLDEERHPMGTYLERIDTMVICKRAK